MITERLKRIQERIAAAAERSGSQRKIQLIAVTKTQPVDQIVAAWQAGLRSIGENRVQEAAQKFPLLPPLAGLTKRMIGTLQSNKINKCLQLFDAIDSISSLDLARKVDARLTAPIDALLEVNTSGEPAKSGFPPAATTELLAACELPGLGVRGLMTIGPLSGGPRETRRAFSALHTLLEDLNGQLPADRKLVELSMGMSDDFEIGIEEGSTMIRIGTAIFGPRQPWSGAKNG